jgi:hypothetical protein
MKLSKYTIAKNCTDINDLKEGKNELNIYFKKCHIEGKKATKTAYTRYSKLVEKEIKLKYK